MKRIFSSVYPDLTQYNEMMAKEVLIKTGFSKVACGGTHVKSTGEVGAITLKRVNVGGGKERIEIKLVNATI